MNRHFQPSLRSFAGSVVYSLMPLLLVVVIGYFQDWDFSTFFWILNALMILLSVGLVFQDVVVHFGQSLVVSPEQITLRSFGGQIAIAWGDIQSGLLRRRKNPVSRNDHLLILTSAQVRISFVTSTLTESAEEDLLRLVRERIQLLEQWDSPAV